MITVTFNTPSGAGQISSRSSCPMRVPPISASPFLLTTRYVSADWLHLALYCLMTLMSPKPAFISIAVEMRNLVDVRGASTSTAPCSGTLLLTYTCTSLTKHVWGPLAYLAIADM
jgi:hypothetical protein